MPSVLTKADSVTCAHMAAVSQVLGNKLVVQNNAALTGLGMVSSCSNVPPPQSNVPCTAVTITGGRATKLKVGGTGVLLASLAGKAVKPPANPGGDLLVTASPKKLNAV